MARTDRSRIEVFPVKGGFRLQRFDRYGRKLAANRKVYSRRNNCRREAIKILRAQFGRMNAMPIVSVERVSR